MTIYKVRMFVKRRIVRGRFKGQIEDARSKEEVVIDNLDTAKYLFGVSKNDAEGYSGLSGYFGKVELFIPHIFEDGTLADWPDGEEYIERFVLE